MQQQQLQTCRAHNGQRWTATAIVRTWLQQLYDNYEGPIACDAYLNIPFAPYRKAILSHDGFTAAAILLGSRLEGFLLLAMC